MSNKKQSKQYSEAFVTDKDPDQTSEEFTTSKEEFDMEQYNEIVPKDDPYREQLAEQFQQFIANSGLQLGFETILAEIMAKGVPED